MLPPRPHLRLALASALCLCLGGVAHGLPLTIDAGTPLQEIVGFGSSTRTADPHLREPARQAYYLDAEAGFGASIFRQFMDDSLLPHPVAQATDITAASLDMEAAERACRIAWDLAAQAGPEFKVVGTVWSPPGWMKASGRADQGTTYPDKNYLLPEYRAHFARYILAWDKMMESKGVRFYAISLQNELLFDEPYPSCKYTTAAEYLAVCQEVCRLYAAEGRALRLFGPEHMSNNWQSIKDHVRLVARDPDCKPYFAAYASHGYVDGIASDLNPKAATDAWNFVAKANKLQFWMTETSGQPHTWDGAMEVASMVHNSLTYGNASAFIYWLANHEAPYHGEELFEAGEPQQKAFAFSHYSRFVRPGAVRIAANMGGNGVTYDLVDFSAYRDDAHGTITAVLLNRSTETRSLTVERAQFRHPRVPRIWQSTSAANVQAKTYTEPPEAPLALTLPPRSITTLVFDAVEITPKSIFLAPNTWDLGQGWKVNALGYLHDAHYPWIYLQASGGWLYVYPQGASEAGFYFYDPQRSGWGWTYRDIYPWYIPVPGTWDQAARLWE